MRLLEDGLFVICVNQHILFTCSQPSRGDVPDLTADPALAERELGFKAPQTLEVMCRDLWNWQTKNPQGYTQQ